MVGPTLIDIREHIDGLATEDGRYYVVCGRTGDRPVPATGNRFPDRATARAAARATEQYRSALRRYDPQVPYYDLIVCQAGEDAARVNHGTGAASSGPAEQRERGDHEPGLGTGTRADPGSGDAPRERSRRIEFCHQVAAAAFEALSDAGLDGVESAVMDAYFELAESVPDLDDLCLRLLESMATEIDRRLAVDEQARVIATAASRLPVPEPTDHPLAATLASLERRDMVGTYRWSPSTGDDGTDVQGAVVRLSGYALSPRDDRLPVLPLVVELVRHGSEQRLSSLDLVDAGDGWQVRIDWGHDAAPTQLASASIQRSEER